MWNKLMALNRKKKISANFGNLYKNDIWHMGYDMNNIDCFYMVCGVNKKINKICIGCIDTQVFCVNPVIITIPVLPVWFIFCIYCYWKYMTTILHIEFDLLFFLCLLNWLPIYRMPIYNDDVALIEFFPKGNLLNRTFNSLSFIFCKPIYPFIILSFMALLFLWKERNSLKLCHMMGKI